VNICLRPWLTQLLILPLVACIELTDDNGASHSSEKDINEQYAATIKGNTNANELMHGIAIYIDYPDEPALVTPSQLDNMLNNMEYQEPGIKRSFRKYWHQQSRGNVDLSHDVFFYTAPQSAAYYRGEQFTYEDSNLLWQQALEWVEANHPNYNWDALSTNDDGTLTAVMYISSAWGIAGVGGGHGVNWTLNNGVKANLIQVSILSPSWNDTHNLFMPLHEAAHQVFRLPDTYDTDYSSGGTSVYSLMSGGDPEVEPIGGPFLHLLGWGHSILPLPGTQTITLQADGEQVLVYKNPLDENEFFTIEARKQSTLGNQDFPAPLGLLIWHSDENITTSNTQEFMTPNSHYRHAIEQADGLFELELGPAGVSQNMGDIYLPGKVFSDNTSPSANWWDGSTSGFEISDIELLDDDQVRFKMSVPPL